MAKTESQSLAQEAFRAQRDIFLHELRSFLESPATPSEARVAEAHETTEAILDTISASTPLKGERK